MNRFDNILHFNKKNLHKIQQVCSPLFQKTPILSLGYFSVDPNMRYIGFTNDFDLMEVTVEKYLARSLPYLRHPNYFSEGVHMIEEGIDPISDDFLTDTASLKLYHPLL